jgi:hypothetical protein
MALGAGSAHIRMVGIVGGALAAAPRVVGRARGVTLVLLVVGTIPFAALTPTSLISPVLAIVAWVLMALIWAVPGSFPRDVRNDRCVATSAAQWKRSDDRCVLPPGSPIPCTGGCARAAEQWLTVRGGFRRVGRRPQADVDPRGTSEGDVPTAPCNTEGSAYETRLGQPQQPRQTKSVAHRRPDRPHSPSLAADRVGLLRGGSAWQRQQRVAQE